MRFSLPLPPKGVGVFPTLSIVWPQGKGRYNDKCYQATYRLAQLYVQTDRANSVRQIEWLNTCMSLEHKETERVTIYDVQSVCCTAPSLMHLTIHIYLTRAQLILCPLVRGISHCSSKIKRSLLAITHCKTHDIQSKLH